MRQPIENKKVLISRVNMAVEYPASFLFVAALNPCPCGFFGDKQKDCSCSEKQILQYLGKVSGPLLDRIDLHVNVPAIKYDELKLKTSKEKSSKEMFKAVERAVDIQNNRFSKRNALMSSDEVEKYSSLNDEAEKILKQAFDVLHLSMRGYHKILKVARTIADLEGIEQIGKSHIQEAILYRSLDKVFKN